MKIEIELDPSLYALILLRFAEKDCEWKSIDEVINHAIDEYAEGFESREPFKSIRDDYRERMREASLEVF